MALLLDILAIYGIILAAKWLLENADKIANGIFILMAAPFSLLYLAWEERRSYRAFLYLFVLVGYPLAVWYVITHPE